ncbi:unnamed protein product [Cylicocyclus nassatus]|uniref:UDP-galactose transporter n=1 Tax=Cylicocyclus nassatus TaxID=53992 RepID=A0AA36MAM9_CYLNA|nr:unnamed protein product [Cylicocyclus nassatus]
MIQLQQNFLRCCSKKAITQVIMELSQSNVHVKREAKSLPNGDEESTIKKIRLLLCSVQFLSMFLLVVEHTGMPFLVRATNKDKAFLPTTCVFFMEIIKMTICSCVIFYSSGSPTGFLQKMHSTLWVNRIESLKVSVPAFAYALQNNLYYIALGNVDATTYTITYQLRILTTAILSVVMLKKEISVCQWGALTLSGIGVILVQMDVLSTHVKSDGGVKWLGILATIGMCWTSAFAGVYFEKMLKGGNSNMFVQNLRLSIMTLLFASCTMWTSDGTKIMEKGLFQGWTRLVWTMVILSALGGIVVSAVMKYADNIKKTYCQTLSIGLTAMISVLIGERLLTVNLVTGVTIVMVSLAAYAFYPPTHPPATPSNNLSKTREYERFV